ncbi:BON domain-containing protein [Fluoribacter dumoffii]|uniref:BON domain-containing protein n=1 Tax=Fluoribacter dumoffii TaxID=463 RepID=UPI002244875D|nr:BON domain-containing protein [Fluoribacter dumoffii]MCW8417092.1 BON domain-containing protein [Fluoribacter dumoffii]MCW8455068.1 BON domain-containing protein [Fluoribacter dumoffii]MCW8460855.1 BON domain-containing protein [Fluoribacter dumoffii]MCW8484297.1 BON domain-containing protein [Fluoribacter dumoffii]
MIKQGCFLVMLTFFLLSLSGCISSLWTGATLVYDRHDVYKKLDDYSLYLKVNHALAADNVFRNNNCVIDIAVFNGDVLLAGHVPTPELQIELRRRLATISGYRRLFNQVKVSPSTSNSVQDSWITAKIRSQIFADGSIDPNAFKIVTSDRVVYLMGDVHQEQAEKVINMARQTGDVAEVVKILKYFTYQSNPVS